MVKVQERMRFGLGHCLAERKEKNESVFQYLALRESKVTERLGSSLCRLVGVEKRLFRLKRSHRIGRLKLETAA